MTARTIGALPCVERVRVAMNSDQEYAAARKLLERLQEETSVHGNTIDPAPAFAHVTAQILADEKPTARVLAIAGWMAANFTVGDWAPRLVAALDDAFHIRLTEDQIRTQTELAASNDRLSRRMLAANWIGVGLAFAALCVAVLPFFR